MIQKATSAQPPVPKRAIAPNELIQLQHLNEMLMRFLPIGIIIIDRNYHILMANTAVRRLLGVIEIGTDQDFLHVVHGIPYNQVRNAIDSAFRERKPVTLAEIQLDPKAGGNGRFITFDIVILQESFDSTEIAAISVTDATEQVEIKRRVQAMELEQLQSVEALRLLNESLTTRNQELSNANEKLLTANEDLTLTQEQVQASLEEFETTNEELQASNEELETANEEIQASNEELQTLNQEVGARSSEALNATDAMALNHATLKEIIDLAPYYIMVLRGHDLQIQAFNSRYVQLLHNEPVQGRPLVEVAHLFWVTGGAVTALARQAYDEDITVTTGNILMRLTDVEGEASERYLTSTIVPSHDPNGKIYGLIIYINDVTAQRIVEIESELDRLRLIFDRIEYLAFALYDAQSTKMITASSIYLAEAERSFDLPRREIIGRTWLQSVLFISPEQATEQWGKLLNEREPIRVSEVSYTLDADQPRVWDVLLLPVIYADEPDFVRFVLFSAVEITEQVRARRILEQENQIKLEFMAVISHELRTPLTSIKGFASTLLATDVSWDSTEQHEFITIISEEANKLAEMIDQLLDLSSIQAGNLPIHIAPGTIGDIINAAQREMEALTVNHELYIAPFADLPQVLVDVQRIAQVLVNLVGNATKYSPLHTLISISFDQLDDEVQINVQDHGSGIPRASREAIFEPFLQLKAPNGSQKGVGLGLSICKGLIERHNGRIWISDNAEPGATVSFTLPVVN